MLSRRSLLLSALAAPRQRPTIDAHIHLFDPARFPYHPNATYKPPAQPLEPYAAFVKQAGIAHTIVVHPEPYQDDHRYLEYCFAHEPSPDFFKGTCLFDPIDPATPGRISALMKKHPGRIVALRIHRVGAPNQPPTTSGAIHDRDLQSPAMRNTWTAVNRLGLAIQMHFIPHYATQIHSLAELYPSMPVILDHLGRPGQGTPEEYEAVLKLAKIPNTQMKFSGVNYIQNTDPKQLIRRVYDAFGPDRMLWGGLGHTMDEYRKQSEQFESLLGFATAGDRWKIRGENAARVFRF